MNTTQSTESSTITGDPWGESDLLVAIQKNISGQPGVLPTARAMSFFGEHALGWMALAAAGYVLDKPRKKQWLATGVGHSPRTLLPSLSSELFAGPSARSAHHHWCGHSLKLSFPRRTRRVPRLR